MSAHLLSFTKQAHTRYAHQLPSIVSLTSKRFYKLSVGSIKKGQVVQLKDKAWKVLTRDHVSTGRGGAVVKVTLIKVSPWQPVFLTGCCYDIDGIAGFVVKHKNQ